MDVQHVFREEVYSRFEIGEPNNFIRGALDYTLLVLQTEHGVGNDQFKVRSFVKGDLDYLDHTQLRSYQLHVLQIAAMSQSQDRRFDVSSQQEMKLPQVRHFNDAIFEELSTVLGGVKLFTVEVKVLQVSHIADNLKGHIVNVKPAIEYNLLYRHLIQSEQQFNYELLGHGPVVNYQAGQVFFIVSDHLQDKVLVAFVDGEYLAEMELSQLAADGPLVVKVGHSEPYILHL